MYKLMIVDDESLVRRGITSLVDFHALNIGEVYEASNGREALEIFEQHGADLILADINMPRMNGLEFAEAVKALKPDVRIAIITGYDYFDYAVKALKIGVEDYILKPISRSDVTEVLTKLVTRLESDRKKQEITRVLGEMLQDTGSEVDFAYREQIQAIIDRELSNSTFSLSALASQTGFSPGYLSGLFKKIFGQTFQDYVLNHRLERAKLLLLTTGMKNYEVAQAVGFDDVNYFGTRFRKRYGLSPRQYQAKVRGSHESD